MKFIKRHAIPTLFYGFMAAAVVLALSLCATQGKTATQEATTAATTTTTKPTTTATTTTTATEEIKPLDVVATAYCPCAECSGEFGFITATGSRAKEGRTLAVDPSVIPYGTAVIIDGNTYIAEDCGGAVKGNRVDIFFNSHEEALNFGRQKLTAYIVE